MRPRRKFTKEYKTRAVELSFERSNVIELAEELGINPNMLYRWRKEYADKSRPSFSGNGKPRRSEQEQRIYELEKHLKDARIEAEILKKAVGIFSKSDRKI